MMAANNMTLFGLFPFKYKLDIFRESMVDISQYTVRHAIVMVH